MSSDRHEVDGMDPIEVSCLVDELRAEIEQLRALGFAIVNAHTDGEAMAAENAWIEYWEVR